MNLIYKSSQSSMQTYLTIESENKTYRIMDLEKNSYDMTSSKTDLTKSIKFSIAFALALNAMSNPTYALVEKEKMNSSYKIEKNITSSNDNLVITNIWIDDFLINAKNLSTPSQLFPYYSKINDLMIESKFISYSKILAKIEVKELNETLIIALLRLSFVWKDEITSWNQFLKKSIDVLNDRSHDSKKLLAGLI